MSNFTPKKIDLLQINNGKRYGYEGISPEAINAPIEASAWAQKVAEEAKLLAEAASGTNTDAFLNAIMNVVAPLHQVLIFTDNTNPAEKYGGYWLKIKDAFLWCSGDQASITYTKDGVIVTDILSVGNRGGEMAHTLTIDEMPSHNHDIRNSNGTGGNGLAASGDGADDDNYTFSDTASATRDRFSANYTGGGLPHNIMPQYFSVNAWVRVTEEEYNNVNESI